MTIEQYSWDLRFLRMCDLVAGWSKDPSTQVGAVLVDGKRRVIGVGYNGFPRGVQDHPTRLGDRAKKYLYVQHAEANAVLQATASTEGATAYVTHHPCSNCAGLLIQAGIARVVTRVPGEDLNARYLESFHAARVMFGEAGVEFKKL